jgi:outer membrane protein
MRSLGLSWVLATGLLSGFAAQADKAGRVGVIDIQRAMFETKRGKAAKTRLEKEAQDIEKRIQADRTTIQKEAEEFDKKAAVMNEKARMEKGRAIQKKMEELQQRAQGSQVEFQRKNEEAFRPVVDGLRQLVGEIARRRNLDMVFENNSSNVGLAPGSTLIWALDRTDITEEAIKVYDEKNP